MAEKATPDGSTVISRIKVINAEAGFIGQLIGPGDSILWECVPRSDGLDHPAGGPHHSPHATFRMARKCAYSELSRGEQAGIYRYEVASG